MRHHDFVIVGAGAAGLQSATLLRSANCSYVLLEAQRHTHPPTHTHTQAFCLEHGVTVNTDVQSYLTSLQAGAEAGLFFSRYPRNRRLISANRPNNGRGKSTEWALRHDWHSLLSAEQSFPEFSSSWYPDADDLVRYLHSIARGLDVVYNASVTSTARRADGSHVVKTADGRAWSGDHIIVATGYRHREIPACLRAPSRFRVFTYETFPAEELRAARPGEAPEFCRGKAAFVFGSGNSAFETADLLSACAHSTNLVYKHRPRFSFLTHYVGDVRVHNAGILDRYQLKSLGQLTGMRDRFLIDQGPDGAGQMPWPGSFRETLERSRGWRREQGPPEPPVRREEGACASPYHEFYRDSPADPIRPERVAIFAGGFTTQRPGLVPAGDGVGRGKFPPVGPFWEDLRTAGKLYAGVLMHSVDYRQSAGGFIHGFRYLIRAQIRYLQQRSFGVPWPRRRFGGFEAALEHGLGRVQDASGLYQMNGILVDVVLLAADGSATYLEEVPKPWIADALGGLPSSSAAAAITIELDYSDRGVWSEELLWNVSKANRHPALFLHPIATSWAAGWRPLSSFHVPEDFDGEWTSADLVLEVVFAMYKAREALRLEELPAGGGPQGATPTGELEDRAFRSMVSGSARAWRLLCRGRSGKRLERCEAHYEATLSSIARQLEASQRSVAPEVGGGGAAAAAPAEPSEVCGEQ